MDRLVAFCANTAGKGDALQAAARGAVKMAQWVGFEQWEFVAYQGGDSVRVGAAQELKSNVNGAAEMWRRWIHSAPADNIFPFQ